MEDRVLVCVDCGLQFIFSVREQEHHAAKKFTHEPKRCPPCRAERRRETAPPPATHITICAGCGREAVIPFRPEGGRPAYCGDCLPAAR